MADIERCYDGFKCAVEDKLTIGEMKVLLAIADLSRRGEPVTNAAIHKLTALDPTRVSNHLKMLSLKSIVVRSEDKKTIRFT